MYYVYRHADLKSCTPSLSMTLPKTEILKNILVTPFSTLDASYSVNKCVVRSRLKSSLLRGGSHKQTGSEFQTDRPAA